MGDTVVVREVSYGWHNWWPRFYNAGTVSIFANDWKLSVLRAALCVTEHSDSSYLKRSGGPNN